MLRIPSLDLEQLVSPRELGALHSPRSRPKMRAQASTVNFVLSPVHSDAGFGTLRHLNIGLVCLRMLHRILRYIASRTHICTTAVCTCLQKFRSPSSAYLYSCMAQDCLLAAQERDLQSSGRASSFPEPEHLLATQEEPSRGRISHLSVAPDSFLVARQCPEAKPCACGTGR